MQLKKTDLAKKEKLSSLKDNLKGNIEIISFDYHKGSGYV